MEVVVKLGHPCCCHRPPLKAPSGLLQGIRPSTVGGLWGQLYARLCWVERHTSWYPQLLFGSSQRCSRSHLLVF